MLHALLIPRRGERRATCEDDVLSVLASRRGREAAFGRELFCDPAWDILLELFAANLADRATTHEHLAKSIDVPISTVKRWTTALAGRGLVLCRDAEERGQAWVMLSPEGATSMKSLMDHWGTAFRSI
jgi:hypothetical protein